VAAEDNGKRMGDRDLLDGLTDDQLLELFLIVGDRVRERLGNPYEQGIVNHTAFSAMFGSSKTTHNVVPRLSVLDPMDAESWSREDVQNWLFRIAPVKGRGRA
jgi:hypothetical protein